MQALTTKKAAKALRVSTARVRQMCIAGDFPHAEKFGAAWAIPECCLSEVKRNPAGNPNWRNNGNRRY